MDSHLRHRIVDKLTNFCEVNSQASTYSIVPGHAMQRVDCADVNTVLQVIEDRVTSLEKVWDSLHRCMVKAKKTASKNANVSEVAAEEAKFQLKKGIQEGNGNGKELVEILDLADQAIVNCPSSTPLTLAHLFILRATILEKCNRLDDAIINVSHAITIAPGESFFSVYNVKYLISAGRLLEAAAFTKKMLFQLNNEGEGTTVYRQTLEELSEAIQQQMTEERIDKTVGDETAQEREEEDVNFAIDYRVRLETQSSKGRQLVASDEIEPQTVILKEKAFSLVLLPSHLLRRCSHCYASVSRIFVPCQNCNSTVYCNSHCVQQHWNTGGHREECGLVSLWTDKSKQCLHVLRQMMAVGFDVLMDLEGRCDLPPSDMWTYINDPNVRETTEQCMETKLKAYKAWLTLYHHSEKFGEESGPKQVVLALETVLTAAMMSGMEFTQLSRSSLVDLVSSTFLAIRRVSLNSFSWSEHQAGQSPVAVAVCLIASMPNHSCQPNAEWDFTANGTLKLTTLKTIPAGGEITISYGVLGGKDAFEKRQKLLAQYFFQCDCDSCQEDATRLPGALQCCQCPGPVLANSVVFNKIEGEAKCLLCGEELPGTKEKLKALSRARSELHLMAQLVDAVVNEEKRQDVLRRMLEHLSTIKEVAFRGSVCTVEDIYAACKVWADEGMLQECLENGKIVDQLLPIEGQGLMVIGSKPMTPSPQASLVDSSVFDLNIDHLLFWASSVYRRTIETTDRKDSSICKLTLRFYDRLVTVIKMVINDKSARLGKLNGKENFETFGLEVEISLMKELLQDKEEEAQQLKEEYEQFNLD